jgi:hypothetical protein
MRLPIELRMRIHEAVLGDRKVHVAFDFAPREYRTFKRKEVLEWRWWQYVVFRTPLFFVTGTVLELWEHFSTLKDTLE